MNTKIVKMDNLGRGITYVDNKITFIPKSITGDTLDVKIVKSKKKYNEGVIERVVEDSQRRIKPKCKYFDVCGGCDLQHLTYEDTLDYKKGRVTNMLDRLGIDISPKVITSPKHYQYRNKITLNVKNSNIGYYSIVKEVVPIDKCLIASEPLNEALRLVDGFGIINGKVTLRCNTKGEVLIILDTNDKLNIDLENLKEYSYLKGIILNNKTYYKDNYLEEIINGISYRYSYDAFFQVNPNVASLMLNVISDNIDSNDKVLDLYCGVGTLSLVCSKVAKEVVGVEIVENAIRDAKYNASTNNLINTKFILNDASNVVDMISLEFNKVIVDPPRRGLSKKVLNKIMEVLPDTIIYVSCDAETLKRDLSILIQKYELKNFYLLDMFSYTYHVETISILTLKP